MAPQSLEDFAALAAVIAFTLATLGLIWNFIVLPNLREQLIKPVQETHRELTQNGGNNNPPTHADKLHDLQVSVDGIATREEQLATAHALVATQHEELRLAHAVASNQMSAMQASLSAIILVIEEHLRWSREYVAAREDGVAPPPMDHQ